MFCASRTSVREPSSVAGMPNSCGSGPGWCAQSGVNSSVSLAARLLPSGDTFYLLHGAPPAAAMDVARLARRAIDQWRGRGHVAARLAATEDRDVAPSLPC